MRLYPPVGLLARTVLEDDTLCGRQMRPNDTVFLPIWALHRHEMWWDRPTEFDPDRFDPVSGPRRDKYQYLPFGAGPRVCVGANFAMMQAQIILATLIQRFRFRPSLPAPHPVAVLDGATGSPGYFSVQLTGLTWVAPDYCTQAGFYGVHAIGPQGAAGGLLILDGANVPPLNFWPGE